MRVENDKKNREAPNKKSGQFSVTYEWMRQAVPDHLVATYACVWAMQKAGMSCSAVELGRRLRRTESTMRRHIRELMQRGLWTPQRRGANGITLANRYVFSRLDVMPEAAAAEKHVAGAWDPPGAGDGVMGGIGDIDRMAKALGDKMSGNKGEGHARKPSFDAALSPELVTRLHAASPRDVDDCVRLLNYETRNMPADQARAVTVTALQQFIDRMELGGVNNPPGLLRTIVKSVAAADGDGTVTKEASVALERVIRGIDAELTVARSPFGVRQKARKRALYYRKLCDGLGSAPVDVRAVPDFQGARGKLVSEMVRAQVAYLDSARVNDGRAASEAESTMNEIERELGRLIASEKGAAE